MFEEAGTVLMRREAIIQRFLNAGEVAAAGLSHFTVMQKIGHAQAVNSGNKIYPYQVRYSSGVVLLFYGQRSG